MFGPAGSADDAGAPMAQDDARAQIAWWLFLDTADRRGFVERVLERRELARALVALRDVGRDRLALALLERAERVGRKIFGRMAIERHRSSASRSRSLFIPSRTRLFTVPSGVFVRAAISLCE